MSHIEHSGSPLRTGAVAGLLTVLGFTVLHQVLISDIWFSLIPMLVAGAICGSSLAWTYTRFFRPASRRTWWAYVILHTAMLLLLGGVSVLFFDPVVPMAALIAANEPPSELIAQAMPLTIAFIFVAAAIPSLLWGRTVRKFFASLLTSAVLVILLGLNVSVLGLVEMSSGSPFVVVEFLALLVVILLGYGAVLQQLERNGHFLSEEDDGLHCGSRP